MHGKFTRFFLRLALLVGAALLVCVIFEALGLFELDRELGGLAWIF